MAVTSARGLLLVGREHDPEAGGDRLERGVGERQALGIPSSNATSSPSAAARARAALARCLTEMC